MAQPTPGKWEVAGTSQIYAGDKLILMSAVKDVPDMAERMANLKLAAAAPDLLEALLEVISISDRKHDAWDKAKAAIKKATENI